ncbi:MAG TPA: ABC transporter ATP-binding protein [Trebonia sp.]
MSAAIEVSHLTKRFGARTAVDDVSFTVQAGEIFGFLGPNGAGKSTTVRMLGGLLAPTSGAASVAGVPVTADGGDQVRQRISVMPETPGLYLKLSVAENLDYFARLYEIPDRAARISQALTAVGLAQRANDLCGTLSKGLRQRTALARTLLNDPQVMFLDEPTSGLDPAAAHEVLTLIGALRDRGVTVFLTTHRLDEAERVCDRVAILNTTLRTTGHPDELRQTLFSRTLTVITAARLPDPEAVFDGLPSVTSWQQVPPAQPAPPDGALAGYLLAVQDPVRAAPAVTRALVAAGADVLQIAEQRASLEEVYLQLITGEEKAADRSGKKGALR